MAEITVVRQVVDLPVPPPSEVTEHRYICVGGGSVMLSTRAGLPEGVCGQFNYGLDRRYRQLLANPIIANSRRNVFSCVV